MDQMKHIPYEKMGDSTANWDVKKNKAFKNTRGKGNQWIITEKVHGSNLCFVTDGANVRTAKRSAFLEEGDDFFGFASVFKKYKQPLMDLFQLIQKDDPTVQSVSVYGELFGGGYPHPDVQADESVQLVQTGVYYCPGLDFCAFDITTSTGPASSRTYLPYTRCLELFTTVGLFHAAILFSGSYEDCLKYPIRFESTIPARLGLPKLATSNVAEGVVIKSDVPVFVDTPKGPVRAIVKKKIPDFAEEMDNQDKNREASDLTSQISSMITINRLKNVISKYGRINPKDQKQKTELIHLMKEDIIGDLKEKGKNVDRDQFKFADDAIRKCIDDFCKQK